MTAWHDGPTLVGRHVTLGPLTREDRSALIKAFADGLEPTFATLVPTPATINVCYDEIKRDVPAGRMMPFTVLDATDRVSGATRFMRMAERHRRVEIGGTLYARRVQRTGLNTEAKRLLLAHEWPQVRCNLDALLAAGGRA